MSHRAQITQHLDLVLTVESYYVTLKTQDVKKIHTYKEAH